MDKARLERLIREFFALRRIELSERELSERAADFMAMAAILNLRDNDEVFGFLTAFEAYLMLNRRETERLRRSLAEAAKSGGNAPESGDGGKENAEKTPWKWIAAVMGCIAATAALCWMLGSSSYQSGKAAGGLEAEIIGKEQAEFLKSEAGRRAFDLYRNKKSQKTADQ